MLGWFIYQTPCYWDFVSQIAFSWYGEEDSLEQKLQFQILYTSSLLFGEFN